MIFQSGWFGGNARIIGECECAHDLSWDNDDLMCREGGIGGWVIFGIIVGVFACLVLLCICCWKCLCK